MQTFLDWVGRIALAIGGIVLGRALQTANNKSEEHRLDHRTLNTNITSLIAKTTFTDKELDRLHIEVSLVSSELTKTREALSLAIRESQSKSEDSFNRLERQLSSHESAQTEKLSNLTSDLKDLEAKINRIHPDRP